MPTYDYACKECGHRFEVFQSMKDPVLTTCPRCEQESLQRLIGAGAGLLFKGSGYYLTDYKKSSVTPPSNGGGDSSSTSSGNGSKADSAATPAPKAPAAEKPTGS